MIIYWFVEGNKLVLNVETAIGNENFDAYRSPAAALAATFAISASRTSCSN